MFLFLLTTSGTLFPSCVVESPRVQADMPTTQPKIYIGLVSGLLGAYAKLNVLAHS